MTYDKKKIDELIEHLRKNIDEDYADGDMPDLEYRYYDLKIKILMLECANEIAGKLKDVF